MVYQTEKVMEDLKDKIDANDKATLDGALDTLKDALKGTDVEAIKAATEGLSKAFYPISEKLYSQTGGPDMGGADFSGGASADGADTDPNVVDADYTVVDGDDN